MKSAPCGGVLIRINEFGRLVGFNIYKRNRDSVPSRNLFYPAFQPEELAVEPGGNDKQTLRK